MSGPSEIHSIEEYLKVHENKEILRFITCGSVDDGKSTLIGRLLHDSKMIFEDQLAALEKDSKKVGTQGGELDLALLVDGLQSEREQGITIDVAYRFFATDKRKYIIADTPGHEQYTRNMATGASTADLAIILIDARYGVQTQTRRHSYIAALLGIKNMIIAVNKMDLVEYEQTNFDAITTDYKQLIPSLPNCEQIAFHYVPMSALRGENVVHSGGLMPWYDGLPLMEMLDTIPLCSSDYQDMDFRFPVQYVNRPHPDFRGYCGTIASGRVSVGDDVTVLPSGKTTRIKSIIPPPLLNGSEVKSMEMFTAPHAESSMAVTLTMEDEIDIGRGDMIVHSSRMPRISNSLKVMVVWMSEQTMTPGQSYRVKFATSLVDGHFEHINYKVEINTYDRMQVESLQLNDIASCKLVLNRPVPADPYRSNRVTGSFILIDRTTNNTVAAGMIVDVSRRDQNKISGVPREYTQAEIELNAYVRKHFPEWDCKAI